MLLFWEEAILYGKPLAQCLLNEDATVTICHSKTKNIEEITRNADILISAVGKPKFITKDMVKPNAVVVDVGINKTKEGIVGDVDYNEVKNKASYISPVPGGVRANDNCNAYEKHLNSNKIFRRK